MSDQTPAAWVKTGVTPEVAKQQILIALTKTEYSIQSIASAAANLVLNEDHLDEIKKFITKTKEVVSAVEAQHKKGKEAAKKECDAWDAAKRDLLGIIDKVLSPVANKYAVICNDINKRNHDLKVKQEKEKLLATAVDNFIIEFSQKIAACTTKAQLTAVESLINLEKSSSRAEKYGHYHETLINRANIILLPIIRQQKIKVNMLEDANRQIAENQDPEKHEELLEKAGTIENEVIQNKVTVQELAMSDPVATAETAVQEPTELKGGRTYIGVEIVDEQLALEKERGLFEITIRLSDAMRAGKEYLAANPDKKDVTVNGIRYRKLKKW